eukprot:4170985-Pyramimonas_sp.AAC.1
MLCRQSLPDDSVPARGGPGELALRRVVDIADKGMLCLLRALNAVHQMCGITYVNNESRGGDCEQGDGGVAMEGKSDVQMREAVDVVVEVGVDE